MADFSGGALGDLGSYADPVSSSSSTDYSSQFANLGDLASYAGGGGPGTPAASSDSAAIANAITAAGGVLGATEGPLGAGVGSLIGSYLGGGLGGMVASSMRGPGGRVRGTHLNKSTYVTRRGGLNLVQKGTKLVTNRRRNAGNAKAVRRSLGRLAMFDNLARKVEGEMARVARRHHHAAPRRAPSRGRGHRPGCRCFACRR